MHVFMSFGEAGIREQDSTFILRKKRTARTSRAKNRKRKKWPRQAAAFFVIYLDQ